MTGPDIPPRPQGSPQQPRPSSAPEAPGTPAGDRTSQPARPRIRPAQSEKWGREPDPGAGSAPGSAPTGAAAPASPPAAGGQSAQPLGYWSTPNGQLYYRAADGQDYYQASDGKFYPVAALLAAQQQTPTAAAAAHTNQTGAHQPGTHPAGTAAAAGTSAADDRSTYYEYIAAHTGEQRVAATGGQQAVPGPPDPGPRRRRTVLTVIGAIAATLVVALAVFLGLPLLGPNEQLRPSQEPDPPTSADSDGSTDEGSPEESAAPESEAPAAEQLAQIAEQDHDTVADRLDGHWVVQLSAKQEGLTTDDRTWTEDDILTEFNELRSEHSNAVLLNSSDWSSYQLDDYWITVLNEPYDDPDDALAVCTDLGIDRDNCFAKKISSTEDPEGTTKLNP
ncbi:hypothetical protein [Brevibacterium otitidis]|uniref:Uncharacterized protein n=1 Tax=Brevibacterium otitidis TaxID=53364 RepID=A0ABV5X3J2_9MICO|nr:hypothetical protein GCM10023233_33940 [Brevibacterium otitidis]